MSLPCRPWDFNSVERLSRASGPGCQTLQTASGRNEPVKSSFLQKPMAIKKPSVVLIHPSMRA